MKMTLKTAKNIDYEVSSGNVYADLGFADAGEMLAKARIVDQIGRIIQARKLTQTQAAAILEIDQPKVSAMLRGHFKGYSQERLIGFLTKLGMDVEIVVRPKAKKRQAEGVVSVVFA
jgi:predicted XRE-type DNA-binding protein